ncbi:MAG TPA: M48 family metalloprotease [Ktedonosporobacter sp.]|nr:M48 family metalloprotease [Ktedonosporobacter sp.]
MSMTFWFVYFGIVFAILPLILLFRFLLLLFYVYILRRKDRNQAFKTYRRGGVYCSSLALGFMIGTAVALMMVVVVQPGGLDSIAFGLHMLLLAWIPYLAGLLYKLADRVYLVNLAEARLLGKKKPITPHLIHMVKAWVLTATPPLLFFSALGLLYMLNALAWRPVLLLAIVVWATIRGFSSSLLHRWALRSVPIAQTEWADLEPRIQQWAALAGVRVDETLVLYLGEEDVATAAATGLGRKTLLLGSALLRKADWRQIDAIIAHELGHIRKHHLLLYSALSLGQALLFASWFVLYDLRPLAFWLFQQDAPFVIQQQAQSSLTGAWYMLLTFAFLYLFSMDTHHRAEFACDRFSVELAGDPMAMAFGLTTLVALNGTTMKMSGPTHPSAERRMKRLLTEPGRFAPWGKDPVPVFVGKEVLAKGGHHYRYIVPLDQATPRQPVPPQPWSRMPLAARSAAPQGPVEQATSVAPPQEPVEQSEPTAVLQEPAERGAIAAASHERVEQGEPTKEYPQAETRS